MTPLDTIRNAAKRFLAGKKRVALTGAGISVDCGIPDFRGQQGIWQQFDPDEYATIEAFFSDPEKAWHFYRCLGDVVLDRSPGAAHRALAELERGGWIDGVVTQNIDGLHIAAGSRQVLEIHGNFQQLQCCYCHQLEPADRSVLSQAAIPRCSHCGERLKPNVVLFGEAVRELAAVERWISECDALLLIGTSGSVFPVADFPLLVHARGGLLIEFNIDETPLSSYCDFRLPGRAEQTVPAFQRAVSDVIARRSPGEKAKRG